MALARNECSCPKAQAPVSRAHFFLGKSVCLFCLFLKVIFKEGLRFVCGLHKKYSAPDACLPWVQQEELPPYQWSCKNVKCSQKGTGYFVISSYAGASYFSKYPSQVFYSKQEKGKALGNASVACQIHLTAIPQSYPRSQARKVEQMHFPLLEYDEGFINLNWLKSLTYTGEGGRSVFWGRRAALALWHWHRAFPLQRVLFCT